MLLLAVCYLSIFILVPSIATYCIFLCLLSVLLSFCLCLCTHVSLSLCTCLCLCFIIFLAILLCYRSVFASVCLCLCLSACGDQICVTNCASIAQPNALRTRRQADCPNACLCNGSLPLARASPLDRWSATNVRAPGAPLLKPRLQQAHDSPGSA